MIDKIAKEVFPDFEKWDAFIELSNKKNDLFNYWVSGYRRILKEKFSDKYTDWQIHFEENLNIYLAPSGYRDRKSMEIWIENGFQLSFWLDVSLFDLKKAKEFIREELASIEKETNQVITLDSNPSESYAFKVRISYDLPVHINSDWNRLIYFADKELPDEMIKVIHPLLSNPRILQLFKDVNNQCLNIN
jgi:hypothetical protein